MSTVYDDYQKRKAERETAEKWNALPAGTKYRNDTFDISSAHCSIKLVRAGQQTESGKNYWETGDAFDGALIQEIVNHPEVIVAAIDRLRKREREALEQCRAFAEGMLADINDEPTE